MKVKYINFSNMKNNNITEEDLLKDFDFISEEIKQYTTADTYLREYEKDVEGLKQKDKKPFFVIPASFTYIISSC